MKSNYHPNDMRVDAAAKIAGTEPYLRDYNIPNKLYGYTVRSCYASAKIEKIEFDVQFDWSNITIVTAADIPHNYVAMVNNDMPCLAKRRVSYIGEPIVLLGGRDFTILKKAAKHVFITYQPEEPLFVTNDIINVSNLSETNCFATAHLKRGNFKKACMDAHKIIKDVFTTPYQEHVYLEPQVALAIPQKKHIHVIGSLQCPYYVQHALDQIFSGTKIKITVAQSSTGGAFGGKEDFPSLLCAHAALLAIKAGKPVLMAYDCKEDIQFTTKRHPSRTFCTAAVTDTGKILGLKIKTYFDGGAYCSLSPVVLQRAMLSFGCYYIPHVEIDGVAVRTNTVPNGAFRGFGTPQAIFSIEMLLEKIAHELQQSPLTIRWKNLLKRGDSLPTGQLIDESFGLRRCWKQVIKASEFQKKYQLYNKKNKQSNRTKKAYGIGVSCSFHGAGFTGMGEKRIKAKATMEICPSGNICVLTANTEMGQGVDTVFRQIVAQSLNISVDSVNIMEKNTAKVPNSGPTVASRSTMIVGKLLAENCNKLKSYIMKKFPAKKKDFVSLCREYYRLYGTLRVSSTYHHPPEIEFDKTTYKGSGYPVYSWAVNIAEIMIDLFTYEISLLHYYTSNDVGKAINKQQCEGQIEGGALQGIGYGLFENLLVSQGAVQNTGFSDYIIPSIMDIPDMHVFLVEEPYKYGPFGAKSLGELPMNGAAPAVVAAIIHAIGIPVNTIPITPEKIFSLLRTKQ